MKSANPVFVPPLEKAKVLGVLHTDGDTSSMVTGMSSIELAATNASSYLYRLSGVASTSNVNLKGHQIEMSAYEEHLPLYKQKPIYCFEHDASLDGVIGDVNPDTIQLTSDSLYFGDIYLRDVPAVRAIAALIENGSVRSQSIGAWVLGTRPHPEMENILQMTKLWLYECSLTSLGADWDAVVDVVKNTLNWSVDAILDALQGVKSGEAAVGVIYNSAKNLYIPDRPKSVVNQFGEEVSSNKAENTGYNGPVPGIAATALNSNIEVKTLTDGVELTSIPSHHRNQTELLEASHAARRTTADGKVNYLLPVARWNVKDQTLVYDWEKTRQSICYALGASAPDMRVVEPREQMEILNRIGQAYRALGKRLPTVDGVAVDCYAGDTFVELSAVEFYENEREEFTIDHVIKNLRSLTETVSANPSILRVPRVENYAYAYMEIGVHVYGDDDAEMVAELTKKMVEVKKVQMERRRAEEEADGSGVALYSQEADTEGEEATAADLVEAETTAEAGSEPESTADEDSEERETVQNSVTGDLDFDLDLDLDLQ